MTITATVDAEACELQPIHRSGSLADKVQDALVELIINRTLQPGHHIVESDIAQQLGVSRQPVREALRSLQGHGWVDQLQGRGTFVHSPTEKEMLDALGIRMLLECSAAKLASSRASSEPKLVRNLRRTVEDARDALSESDDNEALRLEEQLHQQIAELADNHYLSETLERLSRRARWYLQPLAEQRTMGTWDEHEKIVEAIASGDAESATGLMRKHTEGALFSLFGKVPSILL